MSNPQGWGLFGFFYRLDGYQAHRHVQADFGERPLDWRPRVARWLVDQTPHVRRIRRRERAAARKDRPHV